MFTKSGVLQSGRRRIFDLLRRQKRLSRAELAAQSALTRPAVSGIVDELIALDIVCENGRGSSTGGKPPILLELMPHGHYAIGMDLGDDYLIHGVLCSLDGTIAARCEMEYENDFDKIVDVMASIGADLADKVPARARMLGVGVGVSGIVDTAANEVAGGATLDIVRKGLAAALSAKLQLTVRLEKRPNAAALAETLFGAGRNFTNLIYITSGRGVGAGVVIGGELYRGNSGTAGELGRLLLPGGGVLEEETRASALTRKISAVKKRECAFSEILNLYAGGDADTVRFVDASAKSMAYAASVAANCFDPEAIILGGRVLEFGDRYFDCFRRCFEAHSASRIAGGTVAVRRSYFGSGDVAVGGAQMLLDELVK